MNPENNKTPSADEIAVQEYFRVRAIRTDKLDRKNPFERCEYYLRNFESVVDAKYLEPDEGYGYEHARSFVFRIMVSSEAKTEQSPSSVAPGEAMRAALELIAYLADTSEISGLLPEYRPSDAIRRIGSAARAALAEASREGV